MNPYSVNIHILSVFKFEVPDKTMHKFWKQGCNLNMVYWLKMLYYTWRSLIKHPSCCEGDIYGHYKEDSHIPIQRGQLLSPC